MAPNTHLTRGSNPTATEQTVWTTVCIFPSLSTYYSSGSKTCSRIGV